MYIKTHINKNIIMGNTNVDIAEIPGDRINRRIRHRVKY